MSLEKLAVTAVLLWMGFSTAAFMARPAIAANPKLDWEVQKQWQLPENPIDIAHSLDGKYVFVLTREHHVLIYTAQGELMGSVPVGTGVNAIDIAPRAEMLYLIDDRSKTFTALSIDFIKSINTSDSPFKGPTDAPVTLVLFTDFECPYCIKFTPTLDQIVQQNPQTVKLVFKNLPLRIHPFADLSARAALAAGEQGKFWEFHDALFASKKLGKEIIEKIAAQANLDIERWKKDLNSAAIRQKVNADIRDAQLADVNGTPTLFINGRLVRDRSAQGIQQRIDKELGK